MSGLLLHPVHQIIQQLLINLGSSLVVVPANPPADWSCYKNNMPDVPDNCIAVADTVGIAEGREHVEGYLFEKHGILIRYRSSGPVDGFVKASAIQQALNRLHNVAVSFSTGSGTATISYNVQSIKPTGPVIRLGPEKLNTRRYLWTSNHLVSVRLSET